MNKSVNKFLVYETRRRLLANFVKQQFSQQKGKIIIFASFEDHRFRFRQNSTFYYFTGIEEPGAALVIDLDGSAELFLPAYTIERSLWMNNVVVPSKMTESQYGFTQTSFLGSPFQGYTASKFFSKQQYEHLLQVIHRDEKMFVCSSLLTDHYHEQVEVIDRLQKMVDHDNFVNISFLIDKMRRSKSHEEIEKIYQAIEGTSAAQSAAMYSIENGALEGAISGGIEYVFAEHKSRSAFPPIVASGINSTILHYHGNDRQMKDGEVVLVDIGMEFEYYAADITRTYPVSENFSTRQRMLYALVLEAQEIVAAKAKPGMWISNKNVPDKSLYHIALSYFAKHGYEKYFLHGIGHFLGLDVHDVGNREEPLQVGDVITIEPGIYIKEEQIGIRIEDDYWVIQDGVQCLSDALPKDIEEIESMREAALADKETAVDMNDEEDETLMYDD